MSNYTFPEHDKLMKATAEPRGGVLADFIDFLTAKGIHFGVYPQPCESFSISELEDSDTCDSGFALEGSYWGDGAHWWVNHVPYHGNPEVLMPVGGDSVYSQWIAEFYGIDYKAFLAEKEAIYQEMVSMNRKETD